MDFFDHQDRARRRTKLLVFLFLLAVLCTVLALNLVFALVFRFDPNHPDDWARLWNARLFGAVTAGTLGVIGLGSLAKILELRQGGSAVAGMLGGTLVHPHTTDPHERRLLNVVEEMSLASGVPVPQVYLLAREPGINAFAAGLGTQDAAIGVTRGTLRLLSRDELQGVLAHEFSHILNGDMRLNLRLIGLISGLLVLAILGRQLLYVRGNGGSRGEKGNPLPLIGLALIILGGIGVLFGRLIKSAVSRQREFLADAAAVQFTRNPSGLAGALKKIGGLAAGSRLESPKAEEASHLFFGNGLAASWLGLFSTHPPLVDRIRRLDPQFDGTFPKTTEPSLEEEERAVRVRPAGMPPSAAPMPPALPLEPLPLQAPLPSPATWSASGLVAQVGAPTTAHLRHAERSLARLPGPVVAATREPLPAAGLVLALVLSPDPRTREGQIAGIEPAIQADFFAGLPELLPHVADLDERDRLPLVMLAVPALRGLSLSQYEQFSALLTYLVESDREISLFEYALQRLVQRHLAPAFAPQADPHVIQFYSLNPLLPDGAVLLSALAHQGQEDERSVARAFAAGAARLDPGGSAIALLDPAACGLLEVDAALDRLAHASPSIRRQVLEACAQTVGADGRVNRREAEILRAVADALDCPIPPVIEGAG